MAMRSQRSLGGGGGPTDSSSLFNVGRHSLAADGQQCLQRLRWSTGGQSPDFSVREKHKGFSRLLLEEAASPFEVRAVLNPEGEGDLKRSFAKLQR